jgi:hypothetical protein
MHDIVGLFEIHETTWYCAWLGSCVIYLKNIFDPLMIPFVKDEGINLMFMVTTLHSIIDCHFLKLQWIYDSSMCFDCIMF